MYGFPILNKPDLMQRMLGSFDHDVDRLYIVDNGGVVTSDDVKDFRANNIHIADPGFNMGVAGSWNFIIRANIQAAWWLIGCNDIRISPGCIAEVVENMESYSGQPHMCRVVMGNESSWGNHFGLFALNPEAIDMIGWFDENIYPIYFEDNDYMERIKRAEKNGFTVTFVQSNTHHEGNQSYKGDDYLESRNHKTWNINGPYRDSKWFHGDGEFKYPFNIDDRPEIVTSMDGLRYFPQPQVWRIREQDWRPPRKDNVKNDGVY